MVRNLSVSPGGLSMCGYCSGSGEGQHSQGNHPLTVQLRFHPFLQSNGASQSHSRSVSLARIKAVLCMDRSHSFLHSFSFHSGAICDGAEVNILQEKLCFYGDLLGSSGISWKERWNSAPSLTCFLPLLSYIFLYSIFHNEKLHYFSVLYFCWLSPIAEYKCRRARTFSIVFIIVFQSLE